MAAPHPSPLSTEEWGEGTTLVDRIVRDLPELLRPGDALVFNDTRVIRAALQGERVRGDNRALMSFNLHRRVDESRWRAFARPAKRLAAGDRIRFGHEGRVCLLGSLDGVARQHTLVDQFGRRECRLITQHDIEEFQPVDVAPKNHQTYRQWSCQNQSDWSPKPRPKRSRCNDRYGRQAGGMTEQQRFNDMSRDGFYDKK